MRSMQWWQWWQWWQCTRTARAIIRLQEGLVNWLEDNRSMGRKGTRQLEDEVYDPTCLVVWATATKTQGFFSDKMGAADRDSLGTQFLLKAVAASTRLWQICFKLRNKEIRRQHGMSMAARGWRTRRMLMTAQWKNKTSGQARMALLR